MGNEVYTTELTAGFEVTATFTYYPGRPAILNPVDRACPEELPEIEIDTIEHGGTDILALLDPTVMEILETEILGNWEPDEEG